MIPASPSTVRHSRFRRSGAVTAQVAISLTVLLGFTALAVDIGAMYNTKAELQRTADAAALAAVAELGDRTGDPLARARSAAQQTADLNKVLKAKLVFDNGKDFTFGTASLNDKTGKYVFTPTDVNPNAVRVRARRTKDSPSGSMPLFFAAVFGFHETDIWAQATAVLTPRDIAFVLDLSLSHTFDSKLMHYRLTNVGGAMKGVWQSLWDTSLTASTGNGPSFGNMNSWGTETVDSNWNFANDAGLVRLQRNGSWSLTSAQASQSLAAWRAKQPANVQSSTPAAYTSSEMNVINAAGGAGSENGTSSNSSDRDNYRRRVLVALGIYRWKSGMSGGQPGGNGDTRIDANEVVEIVPYPSSSSNPTTTSKQVGGNWDDFVDYVADAGKADNITSNTGLSYRFLRYDPDNSCYGNPQLRWRFGLKSFVDYIQDRHPSHEASPGLSGAPEQPMGAVADAVQASIDVIKGLGGNDQVGVAAYGTVGYGPSDYPAHLSWLTSDFDLVRSKIGLLQAGMWSSNTNISQGIDKGRAILKAGAPNSRVSAKKIMILLTDGNANQTRANPTTSDVSQANADTLSAAADANEDGYRIYTVSVGADADAELMQQVAKIGDGEAFIAQGDIATYTQQLQDVFKKLGGKRPVVLIE
jgi:Flp pilus assembly protein TadG